MTNLIKEASFPTDEDGFLRRECPYCKRQFKIYKDDYESLQDESDYYCPYCGQMADKGKWWTQDQIDYIDKITRNFATGVLNKEFILPMKKKFSNSKVIKFEGKELKKSNEIIQPEPNDMKFYNLKCCGKKLKIQEDWGTKICCYYCGFHHN